MTEFNQREKTLVLLTSYLSNETVKQVPKDTLMLGFKMMLLAQDIILSESDILDIVEAIQLEQKESIQKGFAYMDKNKDMMKHG